MNLWKNIAHFVAPASVGGILKRIQRDVERLRALESNKNDAAAICHAAADDLRTEAFQHRCDALHAARVAERLEPLVG